MAKPKRESPSFDVDAFVKASVNPNTCHLCSNAEAVQWLEAVRDAMKKHGIQAISIPKIRSGLTQAIGLTMGETTIRRHIKEHMQGWPSRG